MKKRFNKAFAKNVAVVMALALTLLTSACGENIERKSLFGTTDSGTESTTEANDDSTYESNLDDQLNTDAYSDDVEYDSDDEALQAEFDEFMAEYFAEYATNDTMTYNYTVKDGSLYGLTEPELTLGSDDMSSDGISSDENELQSWLTRLQSFDRDKLTSNQQLTYDIFQEYFETELVAYDYVYLYEPFSPMRGLQANISTNFTEYRFDDATDVENYIALLYLVPDYFEVYLDFEKEKSEQGYFMCDAVCDEVIEQCETFLDYDDEHFMVSVFNDKVEELDFLTEDEKAAYKEQNATAVVKGLLPAFEATIEVLTSLKGTGTNDGGLCGYSDGKEYYEYLLDYYIGSSKTADETYAMLESKMSELIDEMTTYAYGDYNAYMYFYYNYDSLFDTSDSMSATEIIDSLMENMSANYPDCGTITYVAKDLEESLQSIMDSTMAYYLSPAIDDVDGNIIRVNGLYTSDMLNTLAHEGYPGHMLQNAYFISTDPEPARTTLTFLGYAEGWAMYAGYDAITSYDFDGSEYAETLGELYRINQELSYLVMGMLDIGINYYGWDQATCGKYMYEWNFASDTSALDDDTYYTFVGDPGVYQSYSSAYYEFLEIKEYAKQYYASSYSDDDFELAFNTAVLETGPCQFDILLDQVIYRLGQ